VERSDGAEEAAELGSPFDKLPPEAQKLRLWAMSVRRTGGDTDDTRQDFIAMHDATLRGKIPLIVVSKTPGVDDPNSSSGIAACRTASPPFHRRASTSSRRTAAITSSSTGRTSSSARSAA
jgi:hypothetical protein